MPALTALVFALEPVKVWAGTVPGVPLNICAAAVRLATVGVAVFEPPVPPTSILAASVPIGKAPFKAVSWLNPSGHDPLTTMIASFGYGTNEVHGDCAFI